LYFQILLKGLAGSGSMAKKRLKIEVPINEYISKVQRHLFSVFNMLIINNKISPKRQFQLDSLIRELC
jgi:hypothetical protein